MIALHLIDGHEEGGLTKCIANGAVFGFSIGIGLKVAFEMLIIAH